MSNAPATVPPIYSCEKTRVVAPNRPLFSLRSHSTIRMVSAYLSLDSKEWEMNVVHKHEVRILAIFCTVIARMRSQMKVDQHADRFKLGLQHHDIVLHL